MCFYRNAQLYYVHLRTHTCSRIYINVSSDINTLECITLSLQTVADHRRQSQRQYLAAVSNSLRPTLRLTRTLIRHVHSGLRQGDNR